MKLETAMKVLKDRAENFYGQPVAWLIDEMDNGFSETMRVTEAYETYHRKMLGNVWCGLNGVGFCSPREAEIQRNIYNGGHQLEMKI
tara:strand:+ start:150 stop:410 length:261 start_codon:yes stop_codon:yes gene_type:complete